MLCVYSPFNNVALLDNTVAFVSAKVSIRICVVTVVGDPSSEDYEHGIPDFPYPMIVGPGSVSAPAKTLPDGTSARHLRLFPRTMYVIRG
ncbi:hypothetical protein EDD15DRAFT_2208277 [Pisolithus albus]|nr:hypothetical protein EDD15DRAFT_2208277 [Pisolithus albus]